MRNPSGFKFYPGNRLPALCRDGVIRSAIITGYADTWFSVPAAVQVTSGGKRRTVSGFISPRLWQGGRGYSQFEFTSTGANAGFIPWTAHKPRLAAAARRLLGALTFCRGYKSKSGIPARLFFDTLAIACRLYPTGVKPEGIGFLTVAVIKRLPPELLPRLAVYFDKLAGLYRLFDPIDQSPVAAPPPPPPA
jgi:hypothetical protein